MGLNVASRLLDGITLQLKEERMFDQHLAQKAAKNLKDLREKKPLIHNITNYVVMNYNQRAKRPTRRI